MNLAIVLQQQAENFPDTIAIDAADAVLTFAELDKAVAQTAALLNNAGLKNGDPVLVFQPMSASLYVVLLAIFRLGLVATFLDPSAGREHIKRCCKLYPPKGFIGPPKAHLLRLILPAIRHIPHKFSTGIGLPGARSILQIQNESAHTKISEVSASAPALVTFTSGSTGEPKAAVRTHGFLLTQHSILAKHIDLMPGEVDLCTLPIFALANLASGVTTVIPNVDIRRPGSIDAGPVWQQMHAKNVNRSAASPAFFEGLVAYCEKNNLQLTHLQKVYTGGAPVFPGLLKRIKKIAPQCKVEAVYGSTEAEPISHIDWRNISDSDIAEMHEGKGLLAGKPVNEIKTRILRHSNTQTLVYSSEGFDKDCVPTGQAGEIVVSGDHVLHGYLHDRGNAETKFDVDGFRWHRTGDAGYFDMQGRLWLLGRASAKILDGKGILYPFSVECAVSDISGIRRSALLSHQGKRILVIEADKSFDTTDLRHSLNWASLDDVWCVDSIPVDRRHNAKIDYPALRKLVERRLKK